MLTRNDLLILSHLRQNARMSVTQLSKKTHIPPSTVYDKIKDFKNNEVKRHAAFLDFEKLGYQIAAFLLIEIKKEQREEAQQHLMKHANVNTLFKINNHFDFFVETIFRTIHELEEFKEEFETKFNTKKLQVFYIIKEIKKEGFLSNPEMIDLLQH